jgi:lipopolysaccharide heptosyltransferase II
VKILIIRFSSLGDIIMATAMVRCVRKAFPSAKIDMIVRADFLDLIEHNPHLDRKWGLGREQGVRGLINLVKEINQENYDLIYDAHRSLRTWMLMPFLKARHKVYYRKHYLRRSLALTFKLPLLDKKRMLERYIDPLGRFNVVYDGGGPEMHVGPSVTARAFEKIGLPSEMDLPIIGIVPSAQWPGKRWPISYFRKLVERIVDKSEFRAVVFGGKEDTFCSEIVVGLPTDRVINAQGKLTIAESAAVIKRSELVVANDTGLMHVADALGIASVLFLGPTTAEMGCLPFHPLARVLEENLWCRPCSKNGQAPCIRRRRYCLERISPERALSATLGLVEALKKA